MPRLRPVALAGFAVAALAGRVGGTDPSQYLDSYALFAGSALKAKQVHLSIGNLGVNAGKLTVRRLLDAATSQVVADTVHISPRSTCAQLFGNKGKAAPACGPMTSFQGPIVSDLGEGCGAPASFPACDAGAKLVVRPGETKTLVPGVYGDLVVGGRQATVVLSGSGQYVFCGIRAARSSQLLIGNPAEVDVVGNLTLGDVQFTGALPPPDSGDDFTDVRVFVNGLRVKLTGTTALRHLCAANARLSVAQGAQVYGTFVAETINANRAAGLTVSLVAPGETTSTTTTTTTTTTATLPAGAPRWIADIGTASNKTANTSLSLTTTRAVTAGHDIVIAFGMDPRSGDVTVTDQATPSNIYDCSVEVLDFLSSSIGTRLVVCVAHNVRAIQSGSTITIAHPFATARAASASEFANLAVLDQDRTNSGYGKPVDSGQTQVATSAANELVYGVVSIDGGSGYKFTPDPPLTKLPVAGTTGRSSVTVFPMFRTVTTQGKYNISGTLNAKLYWAAVVATFK